MSSRSAPATRALFGVGMCGNTPIVVFPNGDLGLVGLTGALSPDASTGAEDVAAGVEDNVILADDDDAPPGSGGDGSSTRGNCAALSSPGRGGDLSFSCTTPGFSDLVAESAAASVPALDRSR